MEGSPVARLTACSPRKARMSATVARNGRPRSCTAEGLKESSSPPAMSLTRELGRCASSIRSPGTKRSPPFAPAGLASCSPGPPTGAPSLPAGSGDAGTDPASDPFGAGILPRVSTTFSDPGSPTTSKRPGKPRSHRRIPSVSSASFRRDFGSLSRISARSMLRSGHWPRFATSLARISLSLGTTESCSGGSPRPSAASTSLPLSAPSPDPFVEPPVAMLPP
mmetsp:Transcript_15187/g.33209  ORF Transcript_15187/g.33209 Transcript_15187/m.33209 type:complete len:222 (-) Transcript_15187:148-813(-)